MATKTINQLSALDDVSTNLSSTLFVVYDSESGTTRKATLSQIDTAIERTIQNVSSAAVYANAAFVTANTANIKLQSAYDVANTLFNATAYANVAAITAYSVIANVISNEVEGLAFLSLDPENMRLVNDGGGVKIGTQFVGDINEFTFTANGNLQLPGNLYANSNVIHANTITANTISSIDLVSSNTVVANNVIISGILDVDGVVLQWHTPVPLTSKGDPGDVAGLIAIDNDKLYRCVADYTDGTADIWRFINFTGGTWG